MTVTQTTFPIIAAFYAARGGERSGESDFGVWWTGEKRGMPSTWPRYRVSVVHDTGDLYAVDLHGGAVELLASGLGMAGCHGILKHDATCCYQIADRLLAGWVDHIHEANSLQWIRDALAGIGVAS